jgi:hypothetical protein
MSGRTEYVPPPLRPLDLGCGHYSGAKFDVKWRTPRCWTQVESDPRPARTFWSAPPVLDFTVSSSSSKGTVDEAHVNRLPKIVDVALGKLYRNSLRRVIDDNTFDSGTCRLKRNARSVLNAAQSTSSVCTIDRARDPDG